MSIVVGVHAVFSVVEINDESGQEEPGVLGLENHCADVMDELMKLETSGCGIDSPAVAVDTARGLVEIELRACGGTFEEAQSVGHSSMRAAIHAAGAATPNWDMTSSKAELVSS